MNLVNLNSPFSDAVHKTYTKNTSKAGNVNCSGHPGVEQPDVSDIVRLIDYLYLSREPLCCPEEANTDGVGAYPDTDPDISDIVRIIDYLYINRTPPVYCP